MESTSSAIVAIATVAVVGFNFLLAIGLVAAARWVWRSRWPVRRFTQDLEHLERELRSTLPHVPERLAIAREQLRDLNDHHQRAVRQIVLARQILRLLRSLSGRLAQWRSARSSTPRSTR